MDRDIVSSALGAAVMRLLELRLVKEIFVPQPPAGQDWAVNVPGGVIWEILSFRAQLVTSAVVATRRAFLFGQDMDGNRIFTLDNNITQTASVTESLTGLMGLGTTITGSNQTLPLPSPPIPMQTGYTFRSATSNLDAGDQWSSVILMVRQWSESEVLQTMQQIAAQMTSQVMPEIYA